MKFVGIPSERTAAITEAVDATMHTFTAEYDAAAAQLTLSAAKELASSPNALQARPLGPAPTSPTAAPSLRMSSRPKVALKTVSLGALHAGWLTKKGAVRKNWKRRWFEMSPDFTLRYFDNQDEPRQEKGMVILYNREVETGVSEDEHENCIALRPAVLPGRTYYFVADRSQEVEHWLPFIRAACQLSRHPSSPVPALAGAFHAAYLQTAESVGGPISGAVRPSCCCVHRCLVASACRTALTHEFCHCMQPPAADEEALCAMVVRHVRRTILDDALATLPDWKRKGAEPICLKSLDHTVAAAVTSALTEVRGRVDAFSDATKAAIDENGLEEFVAKEKLLLDAVRAAVGTAALDKLKETPLGQLASAVAAEAAPLAMRAFDALAPAFDSIVATAADVVVQHDLNEDTLASFFLPLAKLLRLPANESAPGLGDKLWSGKPHPLSSAAALLQALPTAIVAALETIDEPALRTRGGKLALAALRSAPSPLDAEGQEAEGSGADSWQTQAGKWFALAISTPLGELLERAAYMFEVQLSKTCEEIPLAPTEQQLREAVDAAAASVRADMMSDAASTKQVAVLDAFRRLLGVAFMSTVAQTAGESAQSVAQPELSYNYSRVLTVDRGLRRVLDMLFDEFVLQTIGEHPEEGTPPLATTQQLKEPAEAAAPPLEDAGSRAAVHARVAALEAKEQQGANELAAPKKEVEEAQAEQPASEPVVDQSAKRKTLTEETFEAPQPQHAEPEDGEAASNEEAQAVPQAHAETEAGARASGESAGEETETTAAASEPAPES